MEKNYYEILEVDKNASEEIIEKSYKTLAKRYHPDVKEAKASEEKMKIINEAYSILSDKEKRMIYDEQLQNATISMQEYHEIMQENMMLRKEIEKLSINKINSIPKTYRESINKTEEIRNVQNQINKKKQKKYTLKDYKKAIFIIVITILICYLVNQIPFVKRFLVQLYNENVGIKMIVDVFKNTINSTF